MNNQSNNSASKLSKVLSKEHKIVEFKTNFEKINSLNTTPLGGKILNSQEVASLNDNNKVSKTKSIDLDRKMVMNELQSENDLMKSMVSFVWL